MNKLLAIIKREYLQRVRTKFFIIMTVLGPLMLVVFTVVPGLLVGMKTGDTRIAIVDQTEGAKLYEPMREGLLNPDRDNEEDDNKQNMAGSVNTSQKDRMEKAGKSFTGSFRVEEVKLNGRPLEDLRRELNARIGRDELEGYLVIPSDILTNSKSKPAYYGRNVGDFMTSQQIQSRLNSAVRRQRLLAEGVKVQNVDALSKSVGIATYPVNENQNKPGA